jgi:hypothetical protein
MRLLPPFSGAPSAGQHREPGGRQTRSPGREPWDRTNHRIDWRPAKGAFFHLDARQAGEKRPWQGDGRGGVAGGSSESAAIQPDISTTGTPGPE